LAKERKGNRVTSGRSFRWSFVGSKSRVEAGTRWNIVPDEVLLEGTLRTHDAEVRRDLIARIERTAAGIAGGRRRERDITPIQRASTAGAVIVPMTPLEHALKSRPVLSVAIAGSTTP
jgi:metal-dependent amidase/aminoacylase/carboxypeptidase family protein